MEREFTAVIEKRGRWYVAFVEERKYSGPDPGGSAQKS
jgi:hypothetical protein